MLTLGMPDCINTETILSTHSVLSVLPSFFGYLNSQEMLSIRFVLASVSLFTFAQVGHVLAVPPLFQLSCGDYPDICDNHCNAFYCHDMNGITLHYDATSDAGEGDKRRTAIGCGSNNYCPSGTDCDEFPYASTYDGGLGCYPDGYNGGDQLQQSGVTRCADPTQNSRHGNALGQFYRDKNLQNGDPFFVGVPDINAVPTVSPLCDSLQTSGNLACPDESTGDYRYRSTPATPACPARGSKLEEAADEKREIPGRLRRDLFGGGSVKRFRVRTSTNETLHVIGRGEGLEVGGSVWKYDEISKRSVSSVIVEIL
jgi:hypothetical protein